MKVKVITKPQRFTELSAEDAATYNGGCHDNYHSRPRYYSRRYRRATYYSNYPYQANYRTVTYSYSYQVYYYPSSYGYNDGY